MKKARKKYIKENKWKERKTRKERKRSQIIFQKITYSPKKVNIKTWVCLLVVKDKMSIFIQSFFWMYLKSKEKWVVHFQNSKIPAWLLTFCKGV